MQDLGRKAFFLAQQAEQQVFGADVLVREPLRLFGSVGQHTLALVAQRQVNRGGHLFADCRVGLDLLADRVHRGVRAEEPVGQCLVLADQAQQQVLGLDVRAAKLARLVAGKEDDPPCLFGVTLEHAVCLSCPQSDGCSAAGIRPLSIMIPARRTAKSVRGAEARKLISLALCETVERVEHFLGRMGRCRLRPEDRDTDAQRPKLANARRHVSQRAEIDQANRRSASSRS